MKHKLNTCSYWKNNKCARRDWLFGGCIFDGCPLAETREHYEARRKFDLDKQWAEYLTRHPSATEKEMRT
jgi:hypothetical protein